MPHAMLCFQLTHNITHLEIYIMIIDNDIANLRGLYLPTIKIEAIENITEGS